MLYRNTPRCIFISIFLGVLLTESAEVYFTTYLSEIGSNPVQCSSIRSALTSGVELIILGNGEPGRVVDVKHFDIEVKVQQCAKKPYLLAEYLEKFSSTFKEDDIIVFNDGSDVLYSTNPQKLEEQFVKMEKNDTVIFSTERNCFPPPCREPSKEVTSSFRYLNAGGWIARYKVAVKFLANWIHTMEFEKVATRDDQRSLQKLLLGNFDDVHIDLDFNCLIFQSAYQTKFVYGNWTVPDTRGPYLNANGIVYNTETNSTPHFCHFNGDKTNVVQIENEIWNIRRKKSNFQSKLRTSCQLYEKSYPKVLNCKRIKYFCDKMNIDNSTSILLGHAKQIEHKP